LSEKNKKDRIKKLGDFICLEKDELKTIIFSDESKFNLKYSDGKSSVCRPPSTGLQMKHITPTVKFGRAQLWCRVVSHTMESVSWFLSKVI
jgi:hypothetical protein